MLDCFEIDHAQPSWPANIWISALVRLFRPQIETLIGERDRAVNAWQKDHPDSGNVYEDRELEITSTFDISVEKQIKSLNKALKAIAA